MKKCIILLSMLFLITGCSAEYTLTYENEIIKESLNISSNINDVKDNTSFKTLIDDYYNSATILTNYNIEPGDLSEEEIIKNYSIYNKSIIKSNNIYGINLNYSFNNSNEYKNSKIVHALYNQIYISDKEINCYDPKNIFDNYKDLNNIIVKFKTDKKVYSTNADEEKKGYYLWYINENNYFNKDIKISFEKNNHITNKNNLKLDAKTSLNILYIIIGALIIGLIIASFNIYIKFKNSNK